MTLIFVNEISTLHVRSEDFPLALALRPPRTSSRRKEGKAAPLAWLRHDLGRLSIQPEPGASPVDVNGMRLTGPIWLSAETRLKIEGVHLQLTFDGAQATLTAAGPLSHEPTHAEQAGRIGERLPNGQAGGAAMRRIKGMLLGLFAVLAMSVAFVLVASPVTVEVTPEDADLTLSSRLPAIPFGDRYLVLPGTHRLEVSSPGYRPTVHDFEARYGATVSVKITLQKLPGAMSLRTIPDSAARIAIDGQDVGTAPLKELEVPAGVHRIDAAADRYFPVTQSVEITGMGERQSFEIPLVPAWGKLELSSDPDGATIRLNGQDIGLTPLVHEPLEGSYEIEITKEGWKPLTANIEVKAGSIITPDTFKLEKADGSLDIASEPSGALVVVDGVFRGQTPLSLALTADKDHQIRASKQGYTEIVRDVRPASGKNDPLSMRLQPEYGTVFVTTTPAGATLRVNGRESGSASQRLSLQTLPQTLEISLAGHETYRTVITPRAGIASRLDIVLRTPTQAAKAEAQRGVFSPAGQRLSLIHIDKPARFTVGSSRREAGRRSNESEYPVELTRSFFVSEKEVTNAEFKKFRPSHNSGMFQGTTLDNPGHPVVNVSWEDAARYANWLSQSEGLQPAYRDEGGSLVPVMPIPNGYRLPTEAEWEFVARYEAGLQPLNRPLQFPWGDGLPPPANSGNYADDGPKRLGFFIPGYNDGQSTTAPVGTYAASRIMLYDIGGNVAEWCHDFYDIYAGPATVVLRDPAGPTSGRFHVVKGASWRSGSITELRLSYRDYSAKPRDDIGFRIARYAPPRT